MTDTQISDERLMAFADGQSDPEEAAIIEAAITGDPALAKRVDMFRETAARLSALAKATTPTVSAEAEARIRSLADASAEEAGPTALEFTPRQREVTKTPRRDWYQLPLAASLFLAIGVAGTYFAMKGGQTNGAPDLQVAGLKHPAVTSALDSLPSGARQSTTGGGEVALIASFTNAAGEFCREFELAQPDRRTVVSVACHGKEGWDVRLAIAAAPAADTGYAPASSLETLDAYLSASQASAPLDEQAEQEALDAIQE